MQVNLPSLASSLIRGADLPATGFALPGGAGDAPPPSLPAIAASTLMPLIASSAGAVPPNPFDGKIGFDTPEAVTRAAYEYIFATYGEKLKGQEIGFEFIQGEDGKYRLGKLMEGEERRVDTARSIMLPGENERFPNFQSGGHTHPAPDNIDENPTFSGPDFGTLLMTEPSRDGVRRQGLMAPDGHMFTLELSSDANFPLEIREIMSSSASDEAPALKKWAQEALASGDLRISYLGNADPKNTEPAPDFHFLIGISGVEIVVPPSQQRRVE